MSKYDDLIDTETWAFIRKTDAFYPPNTVSLTIEEQRRIYDEMCRVFFAGYPRGVSAHDETVAGVPVRHYTGGRAEAHVIYFHGGGFVVGGLDSHDDICAEICAATDCDVTAVDYRLSPEHIFPADFDDAFAVYCAISERSDRPIILVGDSAGGNLAAAISHVCRGRGKRPAGQVLVYPGLGGRADQGSYLDHADAPMLSSKDIDFYSDIRSGGDSSLSDDPRFAPLKADSFTDLPNTFVFSAACDPLCDDGRHYCRAIVAAGGWAQWVREAGLVHGYLRARHSVDRAKASFERILGAISTLAE